MCGINGVWQQQGTIDKMLFNKMRDTLAHRGPDDAGTWMNSDGNIAFGHRRLSFMDIGSGGKQPMLSTDSKIVISVNGEIYNYPQLKTELEAYGHRFVSNSDSEVIIHAWEEWGAKMLLKFNGMFAIALYDNFTKELLLARDRFGIKPLYYHYRNDRLFFASEIKAIITHCPELKKINPSAMSDFFTYRYIPSPGTIYEDISKLEPAEYILFKNGELKEKEKFWTPNFTSAKFSQDDISDQIQKLFDKSVLMHTQSHVGIGSFLSGGYDSSAIVASLNKHGINANTFSIGFDNWDKSEDYYAKIVAEKLNMPHYSKKVDAGHLDILDKLMYHYDEPIADISIIPTYLVSSLAVQHNKAVLSGEGADEFFAGYTWHYENIEREKYNNKLFRKKIKPLAFSVESYSKAMAMGHLRYNELTNLFTKDYSAAISEDSDWFYRKNANLNPGLNRFRNMDMRCFMGELVLTKIDRASMANSLEVRVPFLENELTNFLMKIHPKMLYKDGFKKYQLYRIIKNQLPKEILQRNKQGFVGPDTYYEDVTWYKGIIEDSHLVDGNIINNVTLNNYLKNKEYWKLWKFAVLESWYRKWF